jgi:hypothetical protein
MVVGKQGSDNHLGALLKRGQSLCDVMLEGVGMPLEKI